MDDRTCTIVEDGEQCTRPYACHGMCAVHSERKKRADKRAQKIAELKGTRQRAVPDLPGERWLPVVGWEDFYEVSDMGRVYSHKRMTPVGMRGGRILKPGLSGRKTRNSVGHWAVGLAANGVKDHKYVATLVLEAFVGQRPEGMVARHLDGDVNHNMLSNLTWGTDVENAQDALQHGTQYYASRDACEAGHEYTPQNTYYLPSKPNARVCRECGRQAQRKYQARKRAKLRNVPPSECAA